MSDCCKRINSFVVASVGGQGGLLATGVLARILDGPGWEVKTSEVHGMAQRGGSVLSFVRRGTGAFAPLVDKGEADVVLGLELLEAVRAADYLRPGGLIIASTQQVMPVPVLTGQTRYPDDLAERLQAAAPGRAVLVPAGEIAAELGTARVANVVCLGALAASVDDWPEQAWRDAIAAAVPQRTIELNLEAFRRGRAVVAGGE